MHKQGNAMVKHQGAVLLTLAAPKGKCAVYIYTGVARKKLGWWGMQRETPTHPCQKNGTSRGCYAADRGEQWQQGRTQNLALPNNGRRDKWQ